MVNELIEARIQRCRGVILQILRAEKKIAAGRPAAPVDALVIQSILGRFGLYKSWDHLRDQLEWLEGRKYIRTTYLEMLGTKALLAELNSKGETLMDGVISDPEIILDR